jgi:hypothetical protein
MNAMAKVWASYTPEERARRGAAISLGKTKEWAARRLPRGKCITCGKTTAEPHRKYCSRACLNTDPSWRKGPPKLKRNTCHTCGKENPRPHLTYCSKECWLKDPRRPQILEANLPNVLRGQKMSAQPEIRERAAAKMRDRPQVALLTAKGPANAKAIKFILRSPDGVVYKGRNVLHFVRKHEELFAPEDTVWRRSPRAGIRRKTRGHPQCRASKGLANLFGESEHVRYSWKGWTRLGLK